MSLSYETGWSFDQDNRTWRPPPVPMGLSDFIDRIRQLEADLTTAEATIVTLQDYTRRYAAKARASTTAHGGSNTWVKPNWSVILYEDRSGDLSLTGENYTVPEDGLYFVSGHVRFQLGSGTSSGWVVAIGVFQNGTCVAQSNQNEVVTQASGDSWGLGVADTFAFVAADVIDIRVFSEFSGSIIGGFDVSRFAVHRIGPLPATVVDLA